MLGVMISLEVEFKILALTFSKHTVEAHNSGQVGSPEIVPYCGIFPYFASSLFINGHFGHSGFVLYFASFPYFAVPYCQRLLYILAGRSCLSKNGDKRHIIPARKFQFPSSGSMRF